MSTLNPGRDGRRDSKECLGRFGQPARTYVKRHLVLGDGAPVTGRSGRAGTQLMTHKSVVHLTRTEIGSATGRRCLRYTRYPLGTHAGADYWQGLVAATAEVVGGVVSSDVRSGAGDSASPPTPAAPSRPPDSQAARSDRTHGWHCVAAR